MFQFSKIATDKKKLIIYITCIFLAIITAFASVFVVLSLLKNPLTFFNANSASSLSNFSSYYYQNGIYIPQAAMTLTEDGAKQNVNKIVEEVEKIKPGEKNRVVVTNYAVDKSGLSKKSVQIPVNYLAQNPELPTGCEITSLTTVINYYGYNVTKTDMASKYLEKSVDKIANFWEVFVGDPTKNGFGCYATPIVNAANKYFQDNGIFLVANDYSGSKFEDLLKIVESGTPVIIWSTMYNQDTNTLSEPYATVEWTIDDKKLQWISPEHCMVLIGYDLDRNIAILSDPQRGIVEYDLDTVKARYLALHSQCVVVENMPVISGVKNGATYYTTQCVTVSPRNLSSVTVNGRRQTSNVFLIKANRNETYEITVTDTSGNVSQVVVYTKDIYSLLEPLEGINETNATEENKELINQVLDQILSLDTRYNSSSETQTINDFVKFCNLMLENIDNAEKELTRLTDEVIKYERMSLSYSNNEELNKLLEEINSFYTNDNLSLSQKNKVANLKTRCKNMVDQTTVK